MNNKNDDVNDVFLVFLLWYLVSLFSLLTLTYFTSFSIVSIVDFEQLNANWLSLKKRHCFLGKINGLKINLGTKLINQSLHHSIDAPSKLSPIYYV